MKYKFCSTGIRINITKYVVTFATRVTTKDVRKIVFEIWNAETK